MALSAAILYEMAIDGFRTSAYSDAFQRQFINSLNRVLDELTIAAGETSNNGTAIGHITATSDSISELDEDWLHIVYTGLEVRLMDFGNVPAREDRGYDLVYRDWQEAKAQAMAKRIDSDQSSKDSDGNNESDIIAHGYIDV